MRLAGNNTRRRNSRRRWTLPLLAWLGVAGCVGAIGDAPSGDEQGPSTDDPPTTPQIPDVPWEAVGGEVYVPKVKNLLTGLAATEEEIAIGSTGTGALQGLIDGWMNTAEFETVMLTFFQNAFQQGQLKKGDIEDQFGYFGGASAFANNATVEARMYRDLQQVFPRTALELVRQGRPFNDTVTTSGFMLTVPLMALFLHSDGIHVPDETNDQGSTNNTFLFHQENPNFTFSIVNAEGPIPLSDTLDPNSANYLRWYAPQFDLLSPSQPGCQQDPRTYPGGYDGQYRTSEFLLDVLFGRVPPVAAPGIPNCGTMISDPVFSEEDFDTWHWVEIRKPSAGEKLTEFFDIIKLRSTPEILMRTPRLGFFSTHAFFANWATNSSNQARVTMNQTLIVALGKSFDDTNTTVPVSETALDGEHANPNTPCYACHHALDPMRQFFRQAYTIHYHQQLDPEQADHHGAFAFDGVSEQGNGIEDLAELLASHPRFASAWTQKLCYFARSAPCSLDDPEFLRIAAAFRDSDHDFRVLVRELLSSPLVTEASDTDTFKQQGVITPIALRSQVCQALSARLELADACGTRTIALSAAQKKAKKLVEAIPSDGYSRGAEAPSIAIDPSLFLRAGVEALCGEIAPLVVDAEPTSRYSSDAPDAEIADMVRVIMNLHDPDPRAAAAAKLLREHFDSVAVEHSPGEALTSAFVLACLSPTSVAMGM